MNVSRNTYRKIKKELELLCGSEDVGKSAELANVKECFGPSSSDVSALDLSESESEDKNANAEEVPIACAIDVDAIKDSADDSDKIPEFCEQFLASWALDGNITHTALNALLRSLRTHECFKSLPMDARTLLRTVQKLDVVPMPPGQYYHFGIENGILCSLKECSDIARLGTLELAIGVDGLPIAKSSSTCFWPILCCIKNAQSRPIFPAGIYCGPSKPNSANDYLKDFVAEMTKLLSHGLLVQGKVFNLSVPYFICDTPAKAFICSTKGHTGFNSCTRCITEGEYIEGTVCFPEINAKKKTHADFVNKTYDDHHVGYTILEQIPGVNMIANFPLDCMHLIYLGVTKKMLKLWISGKPPSKLPANKINNISLLLEQFKNYVTSDFSRKPRSLNEISRWKATEFRFFLLYSGPIVLRTSFPDAELDPLYIHFLVLHVAVRMLSAATYARHVAYSEKLLKFFVKKFGELYGVNKVSYNVHNLVHLIDDIKNNGKIGNFTAYAFESCMQPLKKILRKPEKPLQQIIKRISERGLILQKQPITSGILLFDKQHNNGPLLNNCHGIQFLKMTKVGLWSLTINNKDNYCLLQNGTMVKVVNICSNDVEDDNQSFIIGHFFENFSNLYEKPCTSTEVGIVVAKQVSNELCFWPVSLVVSKMMCLPLENKFVLLPILHTEAGI